MKSLDSFETSVTLYHLMGINITEDYNLKYGYSYKVIKNDCRGFNNLSHTIHLR